MDQRETEKAGQTEKEEADSGDVDEKGRELLSSLVLVLSVFQTNLAFWIFRETRNKKKKSLSNAFRLFL